jgi:hypothetical protein
MAGEIDDGGMGPAAPAAVLSVGLALYHYYTPGHDSLTTTVPCSAGRNPDTGTPARRLVIRSCPGV